MARPPRTVTQLAQLDLDALRGAWSKTFRSVPPLHAKRELLIRLLAYGLQEQTHGALSRTSRKALESIVGANPRPPEQAAAGTDGSSSSLRLGARLVRIWNGGTHEVTVMDGAFAYRGHHYRSLSEIAEVITGAHWSGPRFFGLKKSRAKSGERASA